VHVDASPLPPVTLVLGGARSGKSAFAEGLARAKGPALYLATAEPGDAEMAERIRRHQARRGDGWETVEEPLALAAALERYARDDRPILVDCLTLWLTNLMGAARDVDRERAILTASLSGRAGPVIFVANEVGLGVVPASPLGRTFRDHAGRLNQAIAATAHRVVFIAAGLPLTLKDIRP
jgi:adenosylcobinamide kinase/adenosylcobinamide-phosphate guanylyltransferase